MAKSEKYRTLTTIDGTEMIFFPRGFKDSVNQKLEKEKLSGNNMTQTLLFENLSEEIHKSVEAVRNYYKGYNGPDDIETVKLMATFLAVSFMAMLRPKYITTDLPEPVGTDENGIIIQMYQQIIDYVYQVVGSPRSNGDDSVNHSDGYYYSMQSACIQNMYQFLDKAALQIRDDTYRKLRRIIAECEIYEGQYGLFAKRWFDVNPRMHAVADQYYIEESPSAQDAYDEDVLDELLEVVRSDTGTEGRYDSIDYDTGHIFARETASTIRMIFEQEFAEFFSSNGTEA